MKHHFVPEFYFRPWLDDRGHLFQFAWSPRGIVSAAKTPAQICRIDDLNALDDQVPSERRHHIERWLAKEIDDRAAPIIRQILSQGLASIDARQGSDMTRFLLSLIVRRPENVMYVSESAPPDLQRNMEVEDAKLREEIGEVSYEDLPRSLHTRGRAIPGWLRTRGD